MKDYDYGHELNRPPHYFKSLEEKERKKSSIVSVEEIYSFIEGFYQGWISKRGKKK